MLFDVQRLPGDPILELMAAFRADQDPRKVDLGVGVYQDDHGHTPVVGAVANAEAAILAAQTTKSYVGIAGDEVFNRTMTELLFGAEHAVVADGRVVTVQSTGGSGGLRVAGELLRRLRPDGKVWLTSPTWPNHRPLLEAAGLQLDTVRYYDQSSSTLDFDGFLQDVQSIPAGDTLLLHGCCHNPTGADLTPAQWRQIAEVCQERHILPFIDTAYQGFAQGLDADAEGTRIMATLVPELMTVSSCSKNFGLYRERVGALSVVTASAEHTAAIKTHILKTVRAMISMPPDHGARVVGQILSSPELRAAWLAELDQMRTRLASQRQSFVAALPDALQQRFAFVADQYGMFSLLGLTPDEIQTLREEWHLYIVGSSRVNVAGLTATKVGYIAEALGATLAS